MCSLLSSQLFVQTIKFFSPLLLLVFFTKTEKVGKDFTVFIGEQAGITDEVFFGKEIIYSSHKKLIQLNKRREGNQPERVIKEEGESALSRCEIS